MKLCISLLLVGLLAGCAHHQFLCGNALFIFIEGDTQEFSVNFRDDRLLKSDAILSGNIQEWTPGSQWKAEPYFSVSAKLDLKVKLPAIELAIEHGTAGAPSYSHVVVFSAKDFEGSADIPRFDFGGSQPSGKLVLNFKQEADWRRCEIEIAALVNTKPNQSTTAQRASRVADR